MAEILHYILFTVSNFHASRNHKRNKLVKQTEGKAIGLENKAQTNQAIHENKQDSELRGLMDKM